MRKLTFLWACLFLIGVGLANAQSKSVSGKVLSAEDGEPIIGASVIVKGNTSTGTITGVDGGFTINVPGGSTTLVISYVGMKSVDVEAKSGMVVKLESDALAIDEVVVTALGIQRQKRELGYSTVSIKSDELTQGKSLSVATGLQGKVSGLNISSLNSGVFEDVKINLRGLRSLTGSNNPMLLLDGVPVAIGLLSTLNPNDVEDKNVLKGTSAAAVYGPDARNGVIIVTTKSGSKDLKPQITISNTTQFSSVSFFPKFQTKFGSGGSGSYIPYENWSWGPAFDGTQKELGDHLTNGDVQMAKYSATNERQNFFNTGLTLQNDISYSTKGFYLSIQDATIKGIVPDDKNRRTSVRLNASQEYKNFKVSFNTNYVQSNYDVFDNNAMGDYYSSINVGLNGGLMNLIFSTPAQVPLTTYSDFENNQYASYNNYYNRYGINPYIALDTWRSTGKDQNLVTGVEFKYTPFKWLDFNYRAAMTYQSLAEQTTSKRLVVTPFGASRGIDNVPQSVEESSYIGNRLSSDFFASFHHQLGDFRFNVIAGTYVREVSSKTTGVNATNLVIDGLFNVSGRPGELGGGSTISKSRMFSLYGNATLTYKFASLEFSGRNDKTSVLDPSNNSFFYPGVSGSFVVTDALPILKSDAFSFLKLRASWNKTGNADINPYLLNATFSQGDGFPYNGLPGYSADNTAYDKYLEPEFIESKEFGFEATFLKNRVNVDATYYTQNNTNQIVNIAVPRSTGYSSAFVNAASFKNYGFETQLKLTPLVNLGNVKVNFTFNYSYNNSEIISIYDDLKQLSIGGYVMASNLAVVGMPAFVFNATDYKRDTKGRVIVDASTGMPQVDEVSKKVGNTMPKHIIGLAPSITWKGLTVGAVFEYKGGYYNFNMIGNEMAWTGVSAITAENNRERFVIPNSVYEDPKNPGTYIENNNVTVYDAQEFFTSDNYRGVATNFITSAASWRFRELSINYDIPKSLLGNQDIIQGIQIGFVGRNLALWLPKSNVYSDPDYRGTNDFLTGNISGISNATVNPPTRTLGGTIKVTF